MSQNEFVTTSVGEDRQQGHRVVAPRKECNSRHRFKEGNYFGPFPCIWRGEGQMERLIMWVRTGVMSSAMSLIVFVSVLSTPVAEDFVRLLIISRT